MRIMISCGGGRKTIPEQNWCEARVNDYVVTVYRDRAKWAIYTRQIVGIYDERKPRKKYKMVMLKMANVQEFEHADLTSLPEQFICKDKTFKDAVVQAMYWTVRPSRWTKIPSV